MWELAPQHNALLVFAEHRYYGQSKPFGPHKLRKRMHWLTTEQVGLGAAARCTRSLAHASWEPQVDCTCRQLGVAQTCRAPLSLSSPLEQALADYATLVWELRAELQDPDAPVIAFGGCAACLHLQGSCCGGMLGLLSTPRLSALSAPFPRMPRCDCSSYGGMLASF